MKILVINCGSSTLKFDLVETSGGNVTDETSSRLLRGIVDGIGGRSSVSFAPIGATLLERQVDVEDHAAAARLALRSLDDAGYRSSVEAVGHRVVHGGDRFTSSVLIDGVVFGGGIGENSPPIRRRICGGMDWCGLRLDDQRNEAAEGAEVTIHAEGAGIRAYVIPVDEAAIIAREVESCLSRVGKPDDL
jgi:acetate kinase